ncbi:hypothetical protein C6A85_000000108520, partial [Mycobacterium sp. ITM-2017-0098]
CGRGPVIGVAGAFVQTSVTTTVGDLLDGRPVPARPCRTEPIALPAGQQELLVSPGPSLIVDGVQLATPRASEITSATTSSVAVQRWDNDHREMALDQADTERILVVPESTNPGWVARGADGAALTPVTVNGWQQGWVVPAGPGGTVTLDFASNATYRAGLIGGLALLPLLFALALLPMRRPGTPDDGARPWHPGPLAVSAAIAVAAVVILGLVGLLVAGVGVGVRYLLRRRHSLRDGVTVGTAAFGLILAGAVLSQNPWRSVDGYVGHSAGVQFLALLSVVAVAVSTVSFTASAQVQSRDNEDG